MRCCALLAGRTRPACMCMYVHVLCMMLHGLHGLHEGTRAEELACFLAVVCSRARFALVPSLSRCRPLLPLPASSSSPRDSRLAARAPVSVSVSVSTSIPLSLSLSPTTPTPASLSYLTISCLFTPSSDDHHHHHPPTPSTSTSTNPCTGFPSFFPSFRSPFALSSLLGPYWHLSHPLAPACRHHRDFQITISLHQLQTWPPLANYPSHSPYPSSPPAQPLTQHSQTPTSRTSRQTPTSSATSLSMPTSGTVAITQPWPHAKGPWPKSVITSWEVHCKASAMSSLAWARPRTDQVSKDRWRLRRDVALVSILCTVILSSRTRTFIIFIHMTFTVRPHFIFRHHPVDSLKQFDPHLANTHDPEPRRGLIEQIFGTLTFLFHARFPFSSFLWVLHRCPRQAVCCSRRSRACDVRRRRTPWLVMD